MGQRSFLGMEELFILTRKLLRHDEFGVSNMEISVHVDEH